MSKRRKGKSVAGRWDRRWLRTKCLRSSGPQLAERGTEPHRANKGGETGDGNGSLNREQKN